jgi:V-type H+-transporting ATPase subunit a
MTYHRVLFTPESMWATMNFLAGCEQVMFSHETSHHVRRSNNELMIFAGQMVKRCEELQSMLADIEAKIKEYGFYHPKPAREASYYMKQIDRYCYENLIEGIKLFEDMELLLKSKHSVLKEHVENYDIMFKNKLTTLESLEALRELEQMLPEDVLSDSMFQSFIENENESFTASKKMGRFSKLEKMFHSVVGFLETENALKMMKIVFRISRENVIIRTKNIQPVLKNGRKESPKTLVMLLFLKGEQNFTYQKIMAALPSFGFTFLDLKVLENKRANIETMEASAEDTEAVLQRTEVEIQELIQYFLKPKIIDSTSLYFTLKLMVNREMNFAKNLLYVQPKDGLYQLLIWVPKDKIVELQQGLGELNVNDYNFTKPKFSEILFHDLKSFQKKNPPTFFLSNELIQPFQTIIDTYGIPRYKEINPAPFTVISFPFFFGLMFGDVGHGLLVLSFGFYLVSFGSRSLGEIVNLKWLFMLMGFFAVFCGLIYNEFFSVPLLLQGSCHHPETFERYSENCRYNFGIDWIWSSSSNETAFVNSFKMKFSIIIGVVQMLLGIFLKVLNGFYFGNYVDIFFEAIPQFIFMSLIFGYMAVCIIIKWATDWTGKESISIIQLFIEFTSVSQPLYGAEGVQEKVQMAFLIVCAICAVLMFFPKPIISYFRMKRQKKSESALEEDSAIENNDYLITHVALLERRFIRQT